MAVVFGVADHLGYRRFYDRFPRTSGLVEVSRVGFNADDTMALMNARRSCGMDCADDSLLLLAKRAGRWAVVARLILSQS